MSYLNDWDRIIPHLDVVDDYRSEKEEVLACQGPSFPFSFGDVRIPLTSLFKILYLTSVRSHLRSTS